MTGSHFDCDGNQIFLSHLHDIDRVDESYSDNGGSTRHTNLGQKAGGSGGRGGKGRLLSCRSEAHLAT